MNSKTKKHWKSKRSLWLTRLAFLALSAFIWGLLKLGTSEFQTTIDVPVRLVDLPSDKIFVNPLKSVKVIVSAPAMYALKEGWIDQDTLPVSFLRFKTMEEGKFYMPSHSFIQNAVGFQSSHVKWVGMKDSLWVQTSSLSKKKLAVHIDLDIDYLEPYYKFKSPVILPDSVFVFGPEDVLDTMKFLQLPTVVESEVSGNIEKLIPLKLPVDLQSPTKVIQVVQRVEPSTLKTVAVTLDNSEFTNQWKAFPESVQVTCRVPLKDFDRLNGDLFMAVYERLESGDAEVPVLWERQPEFAEIVSWSPTYVELIELKP